MRPHVRIYFDYFDLGEQDTVPSEICGAKAVDIHHIKGRGKGKDVITNLMALCRYHHNACHGLEKTFIHKDVAQTIHDNFLKNELDRH
jgi:hypothetical protein